MYYIVVFALNIVKKKVSIWSESRDNKNNKGFICPKTEDLSWGALIDKYITKYNPWLGTFLRNVSWGVGNTSWNV